MNTKTDSAPRIAGSDIQALQGGWRPSGLGFLITVLCVIGLYWGTIGRMVEMWANSRTFAHGFLILPATAYLIWSYRDLWIRHEAYPSVWGLGALSIAACAWLIGGGTKVIWLQEIAVVAMVPGLMLALFGKDISKTLSWPLGFLMFMVPVGTAIEPWLQDITTWFVRVGLDLVGIPYLPERHRFILTTGTWNVDPDCAGLRYLLPGLALGYAFVTLMYRRSSRRLLFLAVCTFVLLLANGIRAYTIILGDHFGIADGADHRVFSYAVYGLTMPLLLWFGLRWQETLKPSISQHLVTASVREDVTTKAIVVGIAALVILAFPPIIEWLGNIRP
jgi:exosortase A